MHSITRIDLEIIHFVNKYVHHPILDRIFYWITTIGNGGAVWIGIALICLMRKKQRYTGMMVLIALIIGGLGSEVILKPIIARERPFIAYSDITTLLDFTKGFSFPSGHTTSSFAAMTVLCARMGKWRWGAVMLAIAIAFSRLYFHVHYPSDILVGIMLGGFSGLCALFIGAQVEKRMRTSSIED